MTTVTALDEVPDGYQAALAARISELEGVPMNAIGVAPTYTTGNGVATVAIHTAGVDYLPGDVLEIVQALASGCKLEVATIDGSGGVATYTLLTPGLGYSVANDLATTDNSVAGTGCKFNILTLAARAVVADWAITKDVVTDGVRTVLVDAVPSAYFVAEIDSVEKAPEDISALTWS